MQGYEPRRAHRLIDVGTDGVTLFRGRQIAVRPEAIAALLLGSNPLSDVRIGQVDFALSIFHLASVPLVVKVHHFACRLAPKEPTTIGQAEVASFWSRLADSLPPHVREQRDSDTDVANDGTHSTTDHHRPSAAGGAGRGKGAGIGGSGGAGARFSMTHRALLAAQFTLVRGTVAIAQAAHLLDLLIEIDYPDQAATYARIQPTYSLVSVGPCLCGWRRKPVRKPVERRPAARAGRVSGSSASGEGGASAGSLAAERASDGSDAADSRAAGAIGAKRASSPQPAVLRRFESSLAAIFSPRSARDGGDPAAWIEERAYAYAGTELVVDNLTVSNSDADWQATDVPLKSFAQERPDGTVRAHKRIVLERCFLRHLNQYGMATPLTTPVRIETRATLSFAVEGARFLGVAWHVLLPGCVGVSLPHGSDPLQAIVAFLARPPDHQERTASRPNLAGANTLEGVSRAAARFPARAAAAMRFGRSGFSMSGSGGGGSTAGESGISAGVGEGGAAPHGDGGVGGRGASALPTGTPPISEGEAQPRPLPVLSISCSILADGASPTAGTASAGAGCRADVEAQLGEAAAALRASAKLDRQHAKMRKALADLNLDARGGHARLSRLLAEHAGSAHAQIRGGSTAAMPRLTVEQFRKMVRPCCCACRCASHVSCGPAAAVLLCCKAHLENHGAAAKLLPLR